MNAKYTNTIMRRGSTSSSCSCETARAAAIPFQQHMKIFAKFSTNFPTTRIMNFTFNTNCMKTNTKFSPPFTLTKSYKSSTYFAVRHTISYKSVILVETFQSYGKKCSPEAVHADMCATQFLGIIAVCALQLKTSFQITL